MTRRGRGRLSLSDEERRRAQDLLSEALRLERQQQKLQGKLGSSEDTDNETGDTKPQEAEGRPRRLPATNTVASKDGAPLNRTNNNNVPDTGVAGQQETEVSDGTVDAKAETQHKHEGRKRKSHRDKVHHTISFN